MLRGDAKVASQRQLQPTGEAVAVDRGDHRLPGLEVAGDAAEAWSRRRAGSRRLDPRGNQALEVCARAEGAFARTGQHADPDIRVVAKIGPGVGHGLVALDVERVHRLGSVDGDDRDPTLLAIANRHGVSLSSRTGVVVLAK